MTRALLALLFFVPAALAAQRMPRWSFDAGRGVGNVHGGDYTGPNKRDWITLGAAREFGPEKRDIVPFAGVELDANTPGEQYNLVCRLREGYANKCVPRMPGYTGWITYAGVRYREAQSTSAVSVGSGYIDQSGASDLDGRSPVGSLSWSLRAEFEIQLFGPLEMGYRFNRLIMHDVGGHYLLGTLHMLVVRLK